MGWEAVPYGHHDKERREGGCEGRLLAGSLVGGVCIYMEREVWVGERDGGDEGMMVWMDGREF